VLKGSFEIEGPEMVGLDVLIKHGNDEGINLKLIPHQIGLTVKHEQKLERFEVIFDRTVLTDLTAFRFFRTPESKNFRQ
jgi:hypothetical protein